MSRLDFTLDRRVAASLQACLDRGELDGVSLDQARQCLRRAGYPWSSDVQASVQRFLSQGGAAERSRLPVFSSARPHLARPRQDGQDEPGVAEPTREEIEADVLSVVRGGGRW